MKDIMDSQTSREKTEKKYNFSRLVQKSQYFTDTLQIIDYTSLYLVWCSVLLDPNAIVQ